MKKRHNSRDIRKLMTMSESGDFRGTLTPDEAEQSGLGRLSLQMRPMISVNDSVDTPVAPVVEDEPEAEQPAAEPSPEGGDSAQPLVEFSLHKLGNNMHEVTRGSHKVLFSYNTPVAHHDGDTGKTYKTKHHYSVTTSKHINKWAQHHGLDIKKAEAVGLDHFNSKLGECQYVDERGFLTEDAQRFAEDSTDSTAQLDKDVRLSMDKPGQIVPPNAQSDERNPANLGTQDGTKAVHNQDDAYAKQGTTLGMEIPADRRGSYAPTTNKYHGTAPDTPDPKSIGDPQIKRVFAESQGGFVNAVKALMGLGLTLDEANDALDEASELPAAIRTVMEREIATKTKKPNLAERAARNNVQFREAADAWLTNLEEIKATPKLRNAEKKLRYQPSGVTSRVRRAVKTGIEGNGTYSSNKTAARAVHKNPYRGQRNESLEEALDPDRARATLKSCGIDVGANFHALRSEHVDKLLSAAKEHKYRKPKNANGSTARYFHERLQRHASRKK